MNKLVLFLFLTGSLFIFIGISNSPKPKVSTFQEVKSSKETRISPSPVQSQVSNELASNALVTKVVDGDTIDVQINGKKDIVRLIGINAPEYNECFGKEASDKARALLNSKLVSLEADPSQDDRDKYHRLLRYVFVDGTNFDELMVREGYAREYTYHVPYKYQSEFKSAERQAREGKRGLWADGVCSNSSKAKQSSKPIPPSSTNQNFTCDCKKLCSQIATCEEAYFQLNSCGCSARDSDHDGIPCESLCK